MMQQTGMFILVRVEVRWKEQLLQEHLMLHQVLHQQLTLLEVREDVLRQVHVIR